MGRRFFGGLLALSLNCLACNTSFPEPQTLTQKAQRIIHGIPDPGHPAVGWLVGQQDGMTEAYCTATLVGSHTILTAARPKGSFIGVINADRPRGPWETRSPACAAGRR
jgi:hypothetical protein